MLDPEKVAARLGSYESSLKKALEAGFAIFNNNGSALDAVEQAVRAMENDPNFNAGTGSVLNADGGVEMDATVMDGATGRCGAVGGVRRVRHPVTLARAVCEQTDHVLLVGEGAERFAQASGVEKIDENELVTRHRREQWERVRKQGGVRRDHDAKGTVGAVAVDGSGHLAAATSTGGLVNKMVGRVGDSAMIGAGTWADGRVAVSTTGIGERFMRQVTARRLAMLMELGGCDVESAAAQVMDEIGEHTGGLIAVDRAGRVSMTFNTTGMYRGVMDSAGRCEVAVF